jgi:hypothetical protein
MSRPPISRPPPDSGVQGQLDENSFLERCVGYTQVTPQDLLDAKGGKVRYAIDTLQNNRVIKTQYRLGGTLTSVDSNLRYIRLLNPYARVSWSVQLERPLGERIRIWYQPLASNDEIVMFRKLLQQLENGDIKITKVN